MFFTIALKRVAPARLLTLTAIGLLLLSFTTKSTRAQVTATETKLVFNGMQTDALQRTFTVKGNPLPKLSFTRRDLVEAQTSVVLLSNNVAVTTTRDDAANEETFNVTVSGATKPGHYVGNLDINDAGQPGAKPLLTIQLDVTIRSAAAVETDISSKALTMKLRGNFFPFMGQPTPTGDRTGLPVYELYLVQSGEQTARVKDARVLAMKATSGNDLPADIVRVNPATFDIPAGGSAPVKFTVGGTNIRAGEYNGTLQVYVADQNAPVQIPIKLFFKDGPAMAFLVLILGLLAATLFSWWNTKGKGVSELVTSIEQLAGEVETGEKLQAAERKRATELVKQAMDSVEAGAAQTEIKKGFDAAQLYVTTARAEADKFIAETLAPLLAETEAIAPGRTIREGFVSTLQQIRGNVIAGQYQSLDEAQQLVSHPLQGLRRKVTVFSTTADKFKEVAAEKREEAEKKMDEATNLVELRKALADAGVIVPPTPGVSFSADESATPETDTSPRVRLSLKRKLQLSLGQAVVAVIVFLFILAVGWISIYVKTDTFGANPIDYITLFLWGATAEAVRGQTINLTTLKTVVTEQPARV